MAAPRSKPAQDQDGAPPEDTAAQPVPDQPAPTVRLGLAPPHDTFVVGRGLPPVTRDGTDYSPDDADRVRALARRYDVPLRDIPPEPPHADELSDDPTRPEA